MLKQLVMSLAVAATFGTATLANSAQNEWTFKRDIELVSKWNIKGRFGQDIVTGELFRPDTDGRVRAAVIINSSGGVNSRVEPHYARLLAAHGMAALVVDSFMPRGVRRTSDDQSRVSQDKSDADAVAGFRWLAAQPWVDASRIIVMGMSRGAELPSTRPSLSGDGGFVPRTSVSRRMSRSFPGVAKSAFKMREPPARRYFLCWQSWTITHRAGLVLSMLNRCGRQATRTSGSLFTMGYITPLN
jgi:hypothetical protein